MDKKDLIAAGKITSVHGIKGEMKVFSYLEDPKNFAVYKRFYLDGQLFPVKLNFAKKNVAVISSKDITKREIAETHIGKELFMEKAERPELGQGEYYYTDLIGLKLFSAGIEVGKIINMDNFGGGELMEISYIDKAKKNQYLPFKKEYFTKIDIQNSLAEINFPEIEFAPEDEKDEDSTEAENQ